MTKTDRDLIPALTRRVQKTSHGFTDIARAAGEVAADHSLTECLALAEGLFASDAHQARMLATLILGQNAARSARALKFLRGKVSRDEDWRVQEMLAQAFDRYCADMGYADALPVIDAWLQDAHPHVRRAVSEGLRIWTTRDYFREHPPAAVERLSRLKADESEYVRKSAGNALRDISRQHAALVAAELATWDTADRRVAQTHKLAGKFVRG